MKHIHEEMQMFCCHNFVFHVHLHILTLNLKQSKKKHTHTRHEQVKIVQNTISGFSGREAE